MQNTKKFIESIEYWNAYVPYTSSQNWFAKAMTSLPTDADRVSVWTDASSMQNIIGGKFSEALNSAFQAHNRAAKAGA